VSRTIDAGVRPWTVAASLADEEFEHEVKFVVPGVYVPLVLGWLRATCRPDGLHAANRVCSIYYDTPHLDLLREKLNSDFLKLKVRIRWYQSIAAAPLAVDDPAYIEAKSRVGALRRKIRVRVPLSGAELGALSLADARLPGLPERLRPSGVVLPPALMPACRIEYVRHRFVEPATQARICLDWGIEAPATSPRVLPAVPGGRLPVGVLEVKGAGEDLPAVLKGLAVRWARRTSFSKYGSCYEKLRRVRN
jgi:hypothetical protein